MDYIVICMLYLLFSEFVLGVEWTQGEFLSAILGLLAGIWFGKKIVNWITKSK